MSGESEFSANHLNGDPVVAGMFLPKEFREGDPENVPKSLISFGKSYVQQVVMVCHY